MFALEASNSYYMSIPHFADELPFRSSYAYGFSGSPIGFSFEKGTVSADVQFLHVSDSILFGNYIARGFWNIGVKLRGTYQFNDIAGLFLGLGTEMNYYSDISEGFASFSLQAGPQFTLYKNKNNRIDLLLPLSIHLRKEITAPMIGVGIRYSYIPNQKHKQEGNI